MKTELLEAINRFCEICDHPYACDECAYGPYRKEQAPHGFRGIPGNPRPPVGGEQQSAIDMTKNTEQKGI
jgi:hypothetical protein